MPGFKEIFIFVAGTTPQIITETIYALAHESPPAYPDEIYIITTRTGKRRIEDTIIKRRLLDHLAKELDMPPIGLFEDSFIMVRDIHGNILDDIRSREDNEAMGDTITSFVRDKARDKNTRLHCSIAGGRKTMSFYLGSALQLFGRPQDKLYHVLVSPEFESNPDFFYKPKKDRVIECRMPDGSIKRLNTRDARIELAELPFIRLGSKISLHSKGFRELVSEGQKEIDTAMLQPVLMVNLSKRTLHIGERLIEITPVELMIYTAFLRHKTLMCRNPERDYCLDCSECFLTPLDLSSRDAIEEMAKDYEKIYGNRPLKARDLLTKWKDGIDIGVIRQNISKINKTLIEHLKDETLLPYYSVTAIRRYGSSRYGVRVEKGKIKLE